MKALLLLITLVALLSCQIQGKVPETIGSKTFLNPTHNSKEKDFDPQSLVGMPLESAQRACNERSLPHRVVLIDGKPQIVTRDFRPERLNFAVKKGIVIAVTTG